MAYAVSRLKKKSYSRINGRTLRQRGRNRQTNREDLHPATRFRNSRVTQACLRQCNGKKETKTTSFYFALIYISVTTSCCRFMGRAPKGQNLSGYTCTDSPIDTSSIYSGARLTEQKQSAFYNPITTDFIQVVYKRKDIRFIFPPIGGAGHALQPSATIRSR